MTNTISNQDISDYAVRLGDDALILGHRLSEWISNAPFLEEDLALGNVAPGLSWPGAYVLRLCGTVDRQRQNRRRFCLPA